MCSLVSRVNVFAPLMFVGVILTSASYSAELELVGQVSIKGAGFSSIFFAPSEDKVIVQWLEHKNPNAWVIDASTEDITAVKLEGKRAVWSDTEPWEPMLVDELPDTLCSSFFNLDPDLVGVEDAGVTLVNEHGEVLQPVWPNRGYTWPEMQAEGIVAVDGERKHVLVEAGISARAFAMYDPILNRILLWGPEGVRLFDLSGPELTSTPVNRPPYTNFTLVPGQNFLLAHVMEESVFDGLEPKWQKVYIADVEGNLLQELLHMNYPEVQYPHVLIRSSSKLALISDDAGFYLYKFSDREDVQKQ